MFLDREDGAMATVAVESEVTVETPTLQDLVDRLGGIPLSRVLARPAPGSATEADLLQVNGSNRRLCELVEGVLVEKAMGLQESLLAGVILSLLRGFVIPRNLGLVAGPDGTIRLLQGLVRLPDVAFVSWDRIPGGRVPKEPIPSLAPNLAVEVLSTSNTMPEMNRKRREYFEAGVEVVWEVDPDERTVAVYQKGQDQPVVFDQTQTIECAGSLAGFHLVLADLFAELDRSA
jgi:Uma2 family endonuclease